MARRDRRDDNSGPAWLRAKNALREVLAPWVPSGDLGFVKWLGEGASRVAFSAQPAAGEGHLEVVALVPGRWADEALAQRTEMEAGLLRDLANLSLPFRVPRVFGVWPDGAARILVCSWESGLPLDLRAGKQREPWSIVGRLAAAVHGISADQVPSLRPRHAARSDHARAALAAFDGVPEPEANAARAWIEAHLPPADPCVLLHGDLRGANILLGLDEQAVIDWEYATLGDPASDLAVVTRGRRRPFQTAGGLELLLHAHAQAGGPAVTVDQVRIYELALLARRYRKTLAKEGLALAAAQELAALRGLLARVRA